MSQANVELVKRGLAAMQAEDLEAIRELMAPDVRWHAGDPEAAYACRNREQALSFMRNRRSQRRIGQLLDVIDAGERVVVIMQPPPDEAGSIPPPRANVTTIRDGKVVEMVGFESPAAALAHAGLDPEAHRPRP